MWLANYFCRRRCARSVTAASVSSGRWSKRAAPAGARLARPGCLGRKPDDGAGQTLAVRVTLLHLRQQPGVRLFQAGDLALKLLLIGGGTEARLTPRLLAHQTDAGLS
ncbi:hypothetical protein GCM10010383_55370 [Streptomyces lomondensis]|uniref:Uncharacterized protein n=1 Tax=Streptomyces lomondensis TaxID=68229 RepID=A0ABQ2XIB6_9ACTN|nr:hypothetical protein GCM10010383_55370 [Streptomyces lomondensis]